jgi:general secretion pathway protein J
VNTQNRHCCQNHTWAGQAYKGFTLVEVLIVIGIFAVITSISYGALTQYIEVSEKLSASQLKIERMQRALTLMERDFRYMVNRSVRDEYGDRKNAFLVDDNDKLDGEFVRLTALHSDPVLLHSGQLQRVAWRVDEGKLIRESWSTLDRDSESNTRALKVLEDVDLVEIEKYNWSDTFGLQTGTQFNDQEIFPYGLKITLQMKDGKNFSRVFDLANGS